MCPSAQRFSASIVRVSLGKQVKLQTEALKSKAYQCVPNVILQRFSTCGTHMYLWGNKNKTSNEALKSKLINCVQMSSLQAQEVLNLWYTYPWGETLKIKLQMKH
ncbi:hypothetical protein AVEN_141364-1 [Araneus ventricosus]|uniref:Uncharacterized protein n=1 Tax=Araneus ventricosus TaxID=182803 RepID=A0A4Y2CYA2_ARAVE|nr:hypothetical protein AVEN_141364-1 [Araneus ventricosus]